MDSLKPCPFCNGNVKIKVHTYGVASVIDCEECQARFIFPWSKTETVNDLYEAWNRRAKDEGDL